jgi:hypothetical protein
VVEVFGQEVKVRGGDGFVDSVALPNAVLEFDRGVLGQQSYGDVHFHLHLVLEAEVELAVGALVRPAEPFGWEGQIHSLDVLVDRELGCVLLVAVLIGIAEFEDELDIIVNVVSVEVQEKPIFGEELKDVVPRIFHP